MEASLLLAIVKHDIEAARHRHDQLLQALVRMPAALGAAGNVIQVVDALDLERNMLAALDEGEVATRVGDLGEVDEVAVTHRIFMFH